MNRANSIFGDLRRAFSSGSNKITQLILVNVIAFVAVNLIDSILTIANARFRIISLLELPPELTSAMLKFWTLFTYMFMHANIPHIVFNMFLLFFMGRVYLTNVSEKSFLNTFIGGGLAGGFAFLIVGAIASSLGQENGYLNMQYPLVGASAGVLAIVCSVAVLKPNLILNLTFIGPVRLKYLALVIFILSTVMDLTENTGGKIAHIGGALYGYLFAIQFRRGKDIGYWITPVLLLFASPFQRKSKRLKVAYKKTKTDTQFNTNKRLHQIEMDAILDKISKSGYDSLNTEEKDFLFKMSNKNK